jgi:hypothetical protein
MILKMRMRGSHGKNKVGNPGISWRLLDKIKKIDYEYVDEEFVLEKKAKNDPVIYVNNYPKVPNKRVTEIYIVFEDGLGDMFYTDDMVYIMNDAGKTCDTINI